MQEPETRLTLEAPGGLIQAIANCRDGKVENVTIHNVPSFLDRSDAKLEVTGVGTLTVDTAYGGDSFVIVAAEGLGFKVSPDEARDIAKVGIKITNAANEQLGFHHPENPDWKHISFCQITAPLIQENGIGESVIGSRFHCRLESLTQVGSEEAIIPSISGRAWITGTHQHMLDPRDPWPGGYKVSDTWPVLE